MNVERGGPALGVVALVAAVATGSRVLGVVGVGFLLAGAFTWLWSWLVDRPVAVDHVVEPSPITEGDRVRMTLDVRRPSRIPLGSMTVRFTLGRLGERTSSLAGRGRRATGGIDLGRLPRGVYALAGIEVVLGDLLGLLSIAPRVSTHQSAIVVRPRLAELDGLFSESGTAVGDGRRVLLRRSAGFDFHSVREYEQGESLRRVHWPTSARRAQLMVKELEDTTHDGVVVILDCDRRCQAGAAPDSSFDMAVRAAGSIVQLHARRGRTATLVSTGRERAGYAVRSAGADLDGLLTVLAAAEPDARDGLARVLAGDHAWSASGELAVVTATDDPVAFARLLGLAARRTVSVVWIDAPSFASRPTRAEPGLLRLTAHGIPTAVLRRGDDVAAVLSARRLRKAARA